MSLFYPLLAGLTALLAVACGSSGARTPDDFTVELYSPRYAAGFDIRGTEEGATSLVTIRNPWQGATQVAQHLLVLRGEDEAPAGFDGTAVHAPVSRVVCMSSSHVAMFDVLGEAGRIAGVSGIDYLSSADIQARRAAGMVRDVGYDTNLDFELLAAMQPDLVLLYGIAGENTIVTGKLRELGIPYIYVGDYVEESPLGKAEWLMLAAELCDRRDAGADTLRQIATRYEALRTQVDTTAARPRVMLNTPYRDTWFMPSSRSYMIRLIEDAGGEYVYTQNDSSSSVAVDAEEAYLLANDADVWLNVGACNTLGELTAQNPRFAAVPAVRNRRVWNNNRRQMPAGGSDFWESGVVRPDRVLADLIALLHDDGTADSCCCYYKRLE